MGIRAVVSDTGMPEPCRVRRATRELDDVVTLEIVPLSGSRPHFQPGQFNMLYAFGIGEAAISISAATEDGCGYVHTIRNVGAVSAALCGMQEGIELGLRGPFGAGWPIVDAEGSDIVIVGGGLGLAPLRPAIHAILARRERYGRVSILIGCRSPADILYRREIQDWRQRLDIDVDVTVDHADSGWQGNVGVVPSLISRAAFDPSESIALVCGPEVMMRFTANAFQAAGLDAECIYLSMERNMKCAIGHCGHCQFGPSFVCRDGPVMRLDKIASILTLREI